MADTESSPKVDARQLAYEQALPHDFVDLIVRKRTLEAELRSVTAQLNKVDPLLVAAFDDAGETERVVDGFRIYVDRTLWATAPAPAPEKEGEMRAAFSSVDVGHFCKVTVHPQTLSAWVRERADGATISEPADALPEELRPWATVEQRAKMRAARVKNGG